MKDGLDRTGMKIWIKRARIACIGMWPRMYFLYLCICKACTRFGPLAYMRNDWFFDDVIAYIESDPACRLNSKANHIMISADLTLLRTASTSSHDCILVAILWFIPSILPNLFLNNAQAQILCQHIYHIPKLSRRNSHRQEDWNRLEIYS